MDYVVLKQLHSTYFFLIRSCTYDATWQFLIYSHLSESILKDQYKFIREIQNFCSLPWLEYLWSTWTTYMTFLFCISIIFILYNISPPQTRSPSLVFTVQYSMYKNERTPFYICIYVKRHFKYPIIFNLNHKKVT